MYNIYIIQKHEGSDEVEISHAPRHSPGEDRGSIFQLKR